MEDGRAWVRSKDVGPEFSAGETTANVHHEIDGLTPLLRAFSGIAKNYVERRDNIGLDAALGRLVNVSQDLEVLVHQLHHGGGRSLDPLTYLVQSRSFEQRQFLDT